MNVRKNHYELLQVEQTATSDEIKNAYHRLALKYHPDRQEREIEQFRQIHTAYVVLRDAGKRKDYDHTLRWEKSRDDFADAVKSLFKAINEINENEASNIILMGSLSAGMVITSLIIIVGLNSPNIGAAFSLSGMLLSFYTAYKAVNMAGRERNKNLFFQEAVPIFKKISDQIKADRITFTPKLGWHGNNN